jgi:hypothetical protein
VYDAARAHCLTKVSPAIGAHYRATPPHCPAPTTALNQDGHALGGRQ